MKKSISVVILMIIMGLQGQAAENKDQFKIMELAMEEAGLIPNIIKNFVAIKMHFNFGKPQERLHYTIDRLGDINHLLSKSPLDEAEREMLDKTKQLWRVAKEAATSKPTKKNFKKLKKQLPPVFKSCMKLAKYAQAHTGREKSKIFFHLGKLISLPQKFAGMYMSLKHAKGEERIRIINEITKFAKMYRESFVKIKEKMGSNPTLDRIDRDMSFFEYILAPERTFVPALVFRKTDAMSKNVDKLKEMILGKTKSL